MLPEPVEDKEHPIALVGLRFTDVDGAVQRTREHRRIDRQGADLGVLGALRFIPGAEADRGP